MIMVLTVVFVLMAVIFLVFVMLRPFVYVTMMHTGSWRVMEVVMDTMLARLIESRLKSIRKLEAELVELEGKRKGCGTTAALAYEELMKVRRARLVKLEQERAAFELEAKRQLEVPGTAPEAQAPGSIPGRRK